MGCQNRQLLLEIEVFYRPEQTKGRTTRKWILTILKYKNECYKQLEQKKQIKNGVICLVSVLPSWVMVLKTVKILTSDEIAFAAVVYFGQVFGFCRLINKSVLKWFLLIMCLNNVYYDKIYSFSRNRLTLLLIKNNDRQIPPEIYYQKILQY